MNKKIITKEDLMNCLAKLPSGEGIEAKFYKKGGVIVVTFEKWDNHDGEPSIKFRIGRNSQRRFNYTDIDSAWNVLIEENHLQPPKKLLSVILPKKMPEKHTVPHIQEHVETEQLESKKKYLCDIYSPCNGKVIAYQEAERRIADYDKRKESFCHGIGLRKVKLFLNARIKEGDEKARLYRYALEAEGENLKAKKALHKYHSDYHAYDKKEYYICNLADICMRLSVPFGTQTSDAPAALYVVYYELPNCEQISFHTNAYEADSWPEYQGKWDGKKCSTMEKLENAIWGIYEARLKEKYRVK